MKTASLVASGVAFACAASLVLVSLLAGDQMRALSGAGFLCASAALAAGVVIAHPSET